MWEEEFGGGAWTVTRLNPKLAPAWVPQLITPQWISQIYTGRIIGSIGPAFLCFSDIYYLHFFYLISFFLLIYIISIFL